MATDGLLVPRIVEHNRQRNRRFAIIFCTTKAGLLRHWKYKLYIPILCYTRYSIGHLTNIRHRYHCRTSHLSRQHQSILQWDRNIKAMSC